ncbi:MAG: cell envelope biogenesis protein OmpA [Flavobacteriales bacterium]|nr:MAG: cell envelope biogenesis protein OmpA [Flavobacteriales bacterium]
MKYGWILFALAIAITSCVSKKQFQTLEASKVEMEKAFARKNADCLEKNTSLVSSIAEIQAEKSAKEKHLSELKDTMETCQLQLEENLQYIRNLGSTLDGQRQNLATEINVKNKILQTKELELNAALAKAEEERARLEQLRKELEKTSQRVKDLEAELTRKEKAVLELKEAIAKALAGFEKLDIKVEYRNGKVYVILPEKLLFASGSIVVDAKGRDPLIEIGKVLNKNESVQMAIEGHTDNIPMKGSESIKDNWDLSVLRATSIARILIVDAGMNPKRIQAVGRGETQPIVSNDSPEGRAKNRRTEIILTPQLDKILEILNN